jgi:hypothetical protein
MKRTYFLKFNEKRIIVQSFDYHFQRNITEEFTNADSWIVQHELDHLDGILFIDRVKDQIVHFFNSVAISLTDFRWYFKYSYQIPYLLYFFWEN